MRNRPGIAAIALTSRWAKYAPVVILVVLLGSGLFGLRHAPTVVGPIGTAAGHNELVLRALGWCWVGVPLVVITVLVMLKDRVHRTVRGIVATAVLCLAVSSVVLTSGRRRHPEIFFGAVYPDARPLRYGWAAAVLIVFVMLVIAALTFVIAGKVAGTPIPPEVRRYVVLGLTLAWTLLLGVSLWIALTGTMPD